MNLTLGWLYFDLMNTYGDRGNVQILKNRAKARNINLKVNYFSTASPASDLANADLFLMGGAEDRQQAIVAKDLINKKKKVLTEKIQNGTPGLFICGAYQFLGIDYELPSGEKLPGLGIIPVKTKSPSASEKRLIGDLVIKIDHPDLKAFQKRNASFFSQDALWLIGFENHGGRSFITNKNQSLGKVVKGYGNNGLDKTEGCLFQNIIGTYSHGPILPRNPLIADFLLAKALELKYNRLIELNALKLDQLIDTNRQYLLKKLHV